MDHHSAYRDDRTARLREGKERLSAGLQGAAPNALLARSWQRCVSAGLAPDLGAREAPHLCGAELREARERVSDLAVRARPIIDYLYGQIRDSGCIVLLSDGDGFLLDAVGDASFTGRAARVALLPGASWAEADRGTNAVGTALIEAAPVVVHGAEHFLERNNFLACAASPLIASTGELLGVIDISCDQRVYHPHTFGLVRAAAQMIETRMFEMSHLRDIKLRFHAARQGIGTPGEAVLALAADGTLRGANGVAMEMLGLRRADLGVAPVSSVFHDTLDALLARERRCGGEAMELRGPGGRRMFLRVEMPLRPRAPRGTTIWPSDALAALETGDPLVARAIGQARRALGRAIPILIHGETGVGKDVMARAIHASGPRRGGPFVAVNCAALPETMIEAELFGYAPGAFTGARREGAAGRIREAAGGVLFLDEIGDMPLALQTRLLRVLEERVVTPLGGKPVAVDFTLLCATNRDLRRAVAEGRFRADLFYRINGLGITLPPLRRRADLDALVGRILGGEGEAGRRLAPELRAAFGAYDWPGNIRQLANVLRIGQSMCDPEEEEIGWEHLPDDIAEELRGGADAGDAEGNCEDGDVLSGGAVSLREGAASLREGADQIILRAIEAAGGNMSRAARRLGISRNTLYRRLAQIRALSDR
ncbi:MULTISPECIES: sigma-54-dependent Fis family transcriptional regulator [unclassified Acidiphilium]|jgi:transcriptional regulator of acetoin/glycerol metabolism|uniref:sigma-54-dependent Fis family transcriptional regulator n=1 Tax=unclassified Acidiphilium TaxID=2617493 RepID=UPI000BCC3CF1|nr:MULTISPECIES: sigma-54-dependent Fis family transcriptional regulator [unclassified Acidiphilium]OYV54386.1 MAG: sigma-54-dependent Fis family transcriptional regulator [Acidiphilium sp. 20-67-58]HQT62576.1 sigma-54-dependent Fis family transcriptional regulator [Acidiphilium sp.]